MDTVVLPTPPTSGAILHTGNRDGYDRGCGRDNRCVEEMIIQNTINDGNRDILREVANASRDNLRETAGNGRDNLRETGRFGVDNLRETSRIGSALEAAICKVGHEVEKTSAENRVQTLVAAERISENVNRTTLANLLAIKETQRDVDKENAKTREILGQKMWDLEKETLKGFAATQLEALKNKCEIESKIAECCDEQKREAEKTRELIRAERTRELEDRLRDCKVELEISRLRHRHDDHGHGHRN